VSRRLAGLCLLALLSAGACAAAPGSREPLDKFPQSVVQVASGGTLHRFRVWVADTPERRAQGLMWIRELAEDRGMLFVFTPVQYTSFWMQNTYVSLDLLFVAADGRIVNIVAQATPLSTAPLESAAPVRGVLEVPAGTAGRLGIRPGDRVVHPAFVLPASR
jgi:uncharacterized membrane protein (UPF0127 family)